MPTTDTNVGRLAQPHPDLGHDPGAGLHGKVRNAWTAFSNHIDSRYFEANIADTATSTFEHSFDVAFSELAVELYEGVHGSGNLTRIDDPAGAGYTIAAGAGDARNQIDVTNGTGGAEDVALVVGLRGKIRENDISDSANIGGASVPLGTIIAVDDRWTNTTTPATSTISAEGFQLCDGAAAAVGNALGAGPSLPNLTDGRFLRGSTVSGTTGGNSTTTLLTANLPIHKHSITDPGHDHGAGTYAASLGISGGSYSLGAATYGISGGSYSLTGSTTFASSSHTHGSGSMSVGAGVVTTVDGLRFRYDTGGGAVMSTWPGNANFGFGGGGPSGDNLMYPTRIKNSTAGPSATASVGLSGSAPSLTGSQGTLSGSAPSLTGSNSVGGTSSNASTGITETNNTGSATPFSNEPKYLNVKYLMRVK